VEEHPIDVPDRGADRMLALRVRGKALLVDSIFLDAALVTHERDFAMWAENVI
jgi:hypothetical protein